MWKNSVKNNVNIEIHLDNGIYILGLNSGEGKTRMCKLLHNYRKLGEPCLSYTYDDFINGVNLEALVKVVKPKVLMLDRYDMYAGEFEDIIVNTAIQAIVLIDCKGSINFKHSITPKQSHIRMEMKKIIVR